MRASKYTVKPTSQFKKDYKLAMKRGLDISLLEDIIAKLALGESLPEKNRDHALSGNWNGYRECHILRLATDLQIRRQRPDFDLGPYWDPQ